MRFSTRLTTALFAITFCNIANAHPGFDYGYLAGFVHPLLGIDHLLAMLAVGLWTYQLGGRALWLAPVSFVSLMAISASFALSGLTLPMLESSIATTVLLIGILITFTIKVAPIKAAAIVGLFAVFHGFAHGTEIPQMDSSWLYVAGFILSTLMLNTTGILLGHGLNKKTLWLRAIGTLIASSGAWLLVSA